MIDDIDKTEIPEGQSETINFGLDGKSFEIDLSSEHAADLRLALKLYVEAGRKVSTTSRGQAKRTGAGKVTQIESRNEIRTWARANGWPNLPERGRLPQGVSEAYQAHIATKAG